MPTPNASGPDVAAVMSAYEALMHRFASERTPGLLETQVTMAQAKLLFVLATEDETHMSELPARLGVALSTVSGLVDRLVEAGYANRRDDPADRRQVLVAISPAGIAVLERFRDLGSAQLAAILARLAPAELAVVHDSIAILTRAADAAAAEAAAIPDPATPATPDTGKDRP